MGWSRKMKLMALVGFIICIITLIVWGYAIGYSNALNDIFKNNIKGKKDE